MFARCIVQGLRSARFASAAPARHTLAQQPVRVARLWAAVVVVSGLGSPRAYSSSRTADELMEEITELYATAKDEFEIAMEETEKVSVYAEDDRAAAREELEKLKVAFSLVVDGEDREIGEEVRRRVGGRIRELESAVVHMEEMAMNQD